MSKGVLPSSPLLVATAPVFDARLDAQVARAPLDRSLNQLTGKRLGVWVGKRIPLVGGGVGAAVDGWSTLSVARHAMHEFPNCRLRPSGSVTTSSKPSPQEDSPAFSTRARASLAARLKER